MSQDEMIQLLREIKDLQQKLVDLSEKSQAQYDEQIKDHNKEVKRGRLGQIGFLIVLATFFAFLLFMQWFGNNNPQPSWMK